MNIETAIITGSTSGLGLDLAGELVRRGANVVVNGRDPERLADTVAKLGAPDQVAAVAGSIADPATGEALVRAAVTRFGRLDLLVNNAGIFAPKPFVEVTAAELDTYLDVNLKGTYLTTQAAVRQFQAQGGGGAIVNIGTVLVGHAIGGFAASAPVAGKAGVHGLTVSLAAELAADRIRVNLVAPGIIRTPLTGPDADSLAGLAALGRIGEPSEITSAVLYLAESDFITGHVLNVDGGYVTARS